MADEAARLLRFVANGLVASAVHYGVLVLLVEGVGMGSVGIATGLAAVAGIGVSYLGNRHYVLRVAAAHPTALPRFVVCYGVVIGLHSGLMAMWADWAGLGYSAGFAMITAVAASATYLLNRFYVFRI